MSHPYPFLGFRREPRIDFHPICILEPEPKHLFLNPPPPEEFSRISRYLQKTGASVIIPVLVTRLTQTNSFAWIGKFERGGICIRVGDYVFRFILGIYPYRHIFIIRFISYPHKRWGDRVNFRHFACSPPPHFRDLFTKTKGEFTHLDTIFHFHGRVRRQSLQFAVVDS